MQSKELDEITSQATFTVVKTRFWRGDAGMRRKRWNRDRMA